MKSKAKVLCTLIFCLLAHSNASAQTLPGDPYGTTASTGIGKLTPSLADQAFGNSGTYNLGTPSSLQDLRNEEKKLLGDFLNAAPTIKAPPPAPRRPMIAFNESSGRVWVNGFEFDSDDYASAIQSQQYLNAPSQRPKGANWNSLSPKQYNAYLSRITNPTREIKRNAPNHWECILDKLAGIDNDMVARQIYRNCAKNASNRSRKNNSSIFGLSKAGDCLVKYGQDTSSDFAATKIKYACSMLYPN